jgi:hypothetical protein
MTDTAISPLRRGRIAQERERWSGLQKCIVGPLSRP